MFSVVLVAIVYLFGALVNVKSVIGCTVVESTEYNSTNRTSKFDLMYVKCLSGVSWSDAESHCDSEFGTHLVSITRLDENDQVSDVFGSNNGWIGLNDIVTDGSYEWTDGTSFNYANWANNQPTNRCLFFNCEDCVRMNSNGKWKDLYCTNKYPRFACILRRT